MNDRFDHQIRTATFIADESNSSVLLEDTVRSSLMKESTSI
jgi:hypothetical protein